MLPPRFRQRQLPRCPPTLCCHHCPCPAAAATAAMLPPPPPCCHHRLHRRAANNSAVIDLTTPVPPRFRCCHHHCRLHFYRCRCLRHIILSGVMVAHMFFVLIQLQFLCMFLRRLSMYSITLIFLRRIGTRYGGTVTMITAKKSRR
jgi:hypothetical protein